jgi:hypothetical protein
MSSVVISAKFAMVKKFLDFLETKIEIEDLGIKGIFEEFIDVENELEEIAKEKETDEEIVEKKPKKKVTRTKKTKKVTSDDEGEEAPAPIKKTREPTFYNIFTKNHIANPKESGRGMYAKAMAELWKDTEEGQFFSKRCNEMKKENKEMSNVEIYNLVNREWQDVVMEAEEKFDLSEL